MARTALSVKTEEANDVKPNSKRSSPSTSGGSVPSTPKEEMKVDELFKEMKASPSPAPASRLTNAKTGKLECGSGAGTPSRSSSSSTPAPTAQPKPQKPGPQLIGDLPRAEERAMRTFQVLEGNHYQYSTLGRSREALESMTCDCQFVPGRDDPDMACGHDSDCINRLTQVECVEGDCRCRGFCKNQRMQRKEYANIEIVLTEKKGYGLRAGSNIPKDAFIYEYIGDVVSQPSFAKRMREYAEEGIKHFYFMMLQKDEFIDATKRGGIGRFANHSCNPNCYVAKWTVGQHVRMGIYAKRNIVQYEELTFNYNVDRYGHDAQPCYCGEPNCVGVLGGKTQTDVAAMDDLYLDALGISEEVEMYGLKGSKKKKGKKLDEDYVPILKPLVEKDIPKVVQAIRQTQSRKVLLKLLSRIKMTDDQPALRQLMRLRGYSLMCNILGDYLSDVDICTIALECLLTWPLLQRNKVEDSKIEEPVGDLAEHENETVRTLAKKLLEHWSSLEVGYRIPKRLKTDGDESGTPPTPEVITFEDTSTRKRMRIGNMSELPPENALIARLKPLGRGYVKDKDSVPPPLGGPPKPAKSIPKTPERAQVDAIMAARLRAAALESAKRAKRAEEAERARTAREKVSEKAKEVVNSNFVVAWQEQSAGTIIMAARQRAEMERKREEERLAAEKVAKEKEAERKAAERKAAERKAAERKAAERKSRRAKEKARHHKPTPEEKEALKEKRLQKLIGQVVVKCLSKHRDQLDTATFKKKAKELTCVIAEKEKKSNSYQSGKLDALSEEKILKIKKFSKEYIAKLLRKLQKHNGEGKPGSSNSGSGVRPTGSGSGSADLEPMMSVEDALDLGPDNDDNENDNYNDAEDDDDDDDDEKSGDPSPQSDLNGQGPGPVVAVVGRDVDLDATDAEGDVQMGDVAKFGSSPSKHSRWDQVPVRADI